MCSMCLRILMILLQALQPIGHWWPTPVIPGQAQSRLVPLSMYLTVISFERQKDSKSSHCPAKRYSLLYTTWIRSLSHTSVDPCSAVGSEKLEPTLIRKKPTLPITALQRSTWRAHRKRRSRCCLVNIIPLSGRCTPWYHALEVDDVWCDVWWNGQRRWRHSGESVT